MPLFSYVVTLFSALCLLARTLRDFPLGRPCWPEAPCAFCFTYTRFARQSVIYALGLLCSVLLVAPRCLVVNTVDNKLRIQKKKKGKTTVARLLLERGVDVNARRKAGSTPLHLASKDGWLEVARLLIEHGADIGAENNIGMTPLQVARRSDMAELLSDHGSK